MKKLKTQWNNVLLAFVVAIVLLGNIPSINAAPKQVNSFTTPPTTSSNSPPGGSQYYLDYDQVKEEFKVTTTKPTYTTDANNHLILSISKELYTDINNKQVDVKEITNTRIVTDLKNSPLRTVYSIDGSSVNTESPAFQSNPDWNPSTSNPAAVNSQTKTTTSITNPQGEVTIAMTTDEENNPAPLTISRAALFSVFGINPNKPLSAADRSKVLTAFETGQYESDSAVNGGTIEKYNNQIFMISADGTTSKKITVPENFDIASVAEIKGDKIILAEGSPEAERGALYSKIQSGAVVYYNEKNEQAFSKRTIKIKNEDIEVEDFDKNGVKMTRFVDPIDGCKNCEDTPLSKSQADEILKLMGQGYGGEKSDTAITLSKETGTGNSFKKEDISYEEGKTTRATTSGQEGSRKTVSQTTFTGGLIKTTVDQNSQTSTSYQYNGNKLEIKGSVDFGGENNEKAILNRAFDHGLKGSVSYDSSTQILGDSKGSHIKIIKDGADVSNIIAKKGELVSSVAEIKKNQITKYEGDVKETDGTIVLGLGSKEFIYNEKNELKWSASVLKDGTKITLSYGETLEGNIHHPANHPESGIPQTFYISRTPIQNNEDASLNGLYNVEINGQTYYLSPSSGPFGAFGPTLYEKQGEKLVASESASAKLLETAVDDSLKGSGGKFTSAQLGSQSFFSGLEASMKDFRGLGGYSSLFFEEEALLTWRNTVDQAFSTLYLGTEYWSSAICSVYVDGEHEGIAYADTPSGLAQLAAFVEGMRTEGAITEDGKNEFIYRFELSIRNGDYEKDRNAPEQMGFTVQLRGEKTIDLFKGKQIVKRGDRFKRVGPTSIVAQSSTYYNQICILFDQVPYKWRLTKNELCNTIMVNSGTASGFSSTSGGSSGGGSSAGAGDMNEI